MVCTFLGRNFLNSYVLLHTVIIHEKSFILLYSVTVADTFSPWPPKPCTYYLYHFVPPLARHGGTSPYQGWAGELQLAVATRPPAGTLVLVILCIVFSYMVILFIVISACYIYIHHRLIMLGVLVVGQDEAKTYFHPNITPI